MIKHPRDREPDPQTLLQAIALMVLAFAAALALITLGVQCSHLYYD